MKSDVKGKIQDKAVVGDFYNVYVQQENPRYPVSISVSKELYDSVSVGEDVLIPDVISIPRINKQGKPFIASFVPK